MEHTADTMSNFNRVLIAVVDDDESVRESLEGLLTTLGYNVETFASAEGFLGSAALANTDCLILDVCMPGMSGPDLQKELARQEHDIPVILITAHGDEDAVSHLLADGAVGCLIKPIEEEALLRAVDKVLAK